ncbi:hypothetical protein BST21_13390 [Mycolicibacterium celeriflavum]|uniref:DNA topoisomerase (ATP-hydrolyzing) n=1 Tax=Mycolicibacterium celeriflavum TaxID=1249101 RepID=A0A1X0BTX4_MYCCF|nr:hypothetical protein BST21_13390 [Mycolicibacterium celeriflavum]BBY44240.1 hypothetical protein MCEL_25350 [Mycolicibacterium celeriflavum]
MDWASTVSGELLADDDDYFVSRPLDDFRFEDGLHRLVWDVIARAAEDATANGGTTVAVTLLADGGVQVVDDASDSTAGIVMSALHDDFLSELAGKTASPDLAAPYADEPSERNSLPAWLDVEIHRDGCVWFQRYEFGVPGALERRGVTAKTGTTVRCWAESLVCEMTDADVIAAVRRLQQIAFLSRGLTIDVVDQRRTGALKPRTFRYPGGLVDYVKHLSRTRFPLHPNTIHLSGQRDGFEVEIAMQWTASYSRAIHAFDNFAGSPRASVHEEAITDAVTKAVAGPLVKHVEDRVRLRAAVPDLVPDDVSEGLAAVIDVRHSAATPRSPSERLSPQVLSLIYALCDGHLTHWLEANPQAADSIANKAIAAYYSARMPRRSHCRG